MKECIVVNVGGAFVLMRVNKYINIHERTYKHTYIYALLIELKPDLSRKETRHIVAPTTRQKGACLSHKEIFHNVDVF